MKRSEPDRARTGPAPLHSFRVETSSASRPGCHASASLLRLLDAVAETRRRMTPKHIDRTDGEQQPDDYRPRSLNDSARPHEPNACINRLSTYPRLELNQ